MSQYKIVEKEKGLYQAINNDENIYSFDVYPTDMMGRERPPSNLTIETAVCLRNEIEKRGSNPRPKTLLGTCHKNAQALMGHLSKEGYNPILNIGCNIGAGPAHGPIESFRNIRNAHQWVNVNSYTLEICSEAVGCYGRMYVSKRKPRNYEKYIRITQEDMQSFGFSHINAKNIDEVVRWYDDN